MRPVAFQRKIALIKHVCDSRRLYPYNKSHPIEHIGVTANTLDNWIGRKVSPRDSTTDNVNNKIRDYITSHLNIDIVNENNIFSDDFGVMELGHCLGLTRDECRFAIDQQISFIVSGFDIFNMNHAASEQLFRLFRGNYIIYRIEKTELSKEVTGRDVSVMTIPLSVRHLISGTKKMTEHENKIRCKLSVVSYSSRSQLYEYDGYITKKDGVGFFHWVFQSRSEALDDILYLMTGDFTRDYKPDSSEISERFFLTGSIHSRSQDNPASSVVWPVVIEQVDPEEYLGISSADRPDDWRKFEDNESYFMRKASKFFSLDELDPLVRRKFAEANSRVAISSIEI